jgi:aminomethyltransferase
MLNIPGMGDVFAARTGYTGEDGFELLMEGATGQRFWRACLDRGIPPCGLGARDTLRLEAAMHLYGNDMDASTTPLEVGLGWLVHLDMPKPFIGREALEAQTVTGAQRRMIGLKLQDKAIPRAGYPLFPQTSESKTKSIGHITSGGWSPTLEAGIALAMVPKEEATIGTQLTVEIRGKRHVATVCPRPFYRPEPKN